MSEVVVDLTAFEGAGRLIRFRLACDSSNSEIGWYVDDVRIQYTQECSGDFSGPILLSPTPGLIVPFDEPLILNWRDMIGENNVYQVFWGLGADAPNLLGESQQSFLVAPTALLKAGTRYYWRVEVDGSLGQSTSVTDTFRTQSIDASRLADQIVGLAPGLTPPELTASDYDDDGVIRVNDLVINLNRRE